jgi:WD40 repeat protein
MLSHKRLFLLIFLSSASVYQSQAMFNPKTATPVEAAARRAEEIAARLAAGESIVLATPQINNTQSNATQTIPEVTRGATAADRADAKTSCEQKEQADFIKTAALFNVLPKELQDNIHGFNSIFTRLQAPKSTSCSCMATYRDEGGLKLIYGADRGYIHVWDLEKNRLTLTIKAHMYSCQPSQIVPYQDETGWKAISNSVDLKLHVWDLTTGVRLHTFENIHASRITTYQDADGHKALVGLYTGDLQLLDLSTGKLLHTLRGHTGPVYCISTYQDKNGWKAVAGAGVGALSVWDLTTGTCIHKLEDQAGGLRKLYTWQDKTVWKAISLSYYADQKCNSIRIWNLSSGECIQAFDFDIKDRNIQTMYQDETGWKIICSKSHDESNQYNPIDYVQDLMTGKQLCALENDGFGVLKKNYSYFTIHRDNTGWKACARDYDDEKIMKIWDLTTGKCLHTLTGFAEKIYCTTTCQDDIGVKIIAGICYNRDSEVPAIYIWGHAPGKAETIIAEEREFHDAKKLINKMSKECGGGTPVALQQIIYEYARPTDNADKADQKSNS